MFLGSKNAYLGSTSQPRLSVLHGAQNLIVSVVTLLCLAFPLPARAKPPLACATASQAATTRQFDRSSYALATDNHGAVARFYTKDAVLHLSPSVAFLIGRAAIRANFTDILLRHPQGALAELLITCALVNSEGVLLTIRNASFSKARIICEMAERAAVEVHP
jgi:hypothetical protein